MKDLEEELKPCPHGCSDVKPILTTAMGESWVYCPACKCSSGMQATKEGVIDLWNTRSEDLEQRRKDFEAARQGYSDGSTAANKFYFDYKDFRDYLKSRLKF